MLIVTTVDNMLRDFLLPFARHFRAQGWRVDALSAPDETHDECAPAFDTMWDAGWSRNPLDPRGFLSTIRRVRAVVARGEYDIVHVHTPIAAFVTRFALRGMRQAGTPKVIYTAHGFHFHRDGGRLTNLLYLTLEKLAGRWTDYLVVINREDEGAALRYRIVPPGRLRYMPGIGLDLRKYDPASVSAADIARVRDELGLGAHGAFFLMIAEFTLNKSHPDALHALANLNRSDVHLAIAGEGPEMESVRQLAADLGIKDRVHFLGYRRDIPTLVRASVATVLVSRREGLPRSTMESLCLGTPAIGTEIRGIRDLLANGCGQLVPVGDPAAIATAMAWMLDHPAAVRAMGKRGRERMADYDLGHIIALHEELYADALHTAPGGIRNGIGSAGFSLQEA